MLVAPDIIEYVRKAHNDMHASIFIDNTDYKCAVYTQINIETLMRIQLYITNVIKCMGGRYICT